MNDASFLYSGEGVLLVASVVLFFGILASKAGFRMGLPSLLLFLFVGMLFGSEGAGIKFKDPETMQFIGMLALSIILFSGGMETHYSDIKPVVKPGLSLATVGVLITVIITGLFIYYLSIYLGSESNHLSYPESFLLAAIMASTDSASVFSILRSKKVVLKQKLGSMLELESGSNDPMGYMLTIFLIGYIQKGGLNFTDAVMTLGVELVVGAIGGYVIGKAAVWLINKINIDIKSLYPILLLTVTFFTFSFTHLCHGNGYLAVYLAGLIVGNSDIVHKKETQTFFDGFSWLWQIVMFISLGLLINPFGLIKIAPVGLTIGFVMIFIARPISVFLSLLPFRSISPKGKLFVSWVGLRGAVPIIFATYPLIAGVENAMIFFYIVFFMTIVSLLVQGTTVIALAKRLDLIEKEEVAASE